MRKSIHIRIKKSAEGTILEIKELMQSIDAGFEDERIAEVYGYGSLEDQKKRIEDALIQFKNIYTDYGIAEAGLLCDNDVHVFSAPGRMEVIGNHTDHQNGKVIASSIDIDMIAVAGRNNDNVIRISSEGFEEVEVDIERLEAIPDEKGSSAAIVRGVAAVLRNMDFRIGGFNAYVTSNIPEGAGVSSSAAFEVLVGTIISGIFNENLIDPVTIAKAGQKAENDYFGKPSGLMDQMACAVGGMIYIDFKDPSEPIYEKIDVDLEKKGYKICLTDTGSSHADLTEHYAAIPADMKKVASFFAKTVLRDVPEEEIGANIGSLIASCGERAVKRTIHFVNEMERVDELKTCLINIDGQVEKSVNGPDEEIIMVSSVERMLEIMCKSGESSFKDLGNVMIPGERRANKLVEALDLSWELLMGKGAFRVHGGGFAGTILAIVPDELLEIYVQGMNEEFGEGKCRVYNIRQVGGIQIV